MFTFDRKTLKSIDTGFADSWYTSTEDRPNASVIGGMTTPQAYAYVAWVYAAVQKISEAVRAYPFELWRGEDVVTDDPRYDSFMRDMRENLKYAVQCQLLAGAAYWGINTNASGRDIRFDPLPVNTVKPKNDNDGELVGFTYTYGGKQRELRVNELIYFWERSLTKRNQPGISPAMVALGPASQLFAIDSFAASYFNRGGVPVTIWPIDPATPTEERDRFQSWLNRSAGGVAQAFRNLVIRTRPDVKPQQVGANVKETQAPELVKIARDNVSAAFGIPPSILSGENSDKSNQSADYAAFYQFCITPLMVELCDTINEQFFDAQLKQEGLELYPDPEKLPVNGEAYLNKAKALFELTQSPVLTVDEAREMLGLEPMAVEMAEDAQEAAEQLAEEMADESTPETEQDTQGETETDGAEIDAESMKKILSDWRARVLKNLSESGSTKTTSIKALIHFPRLAERIDNELRDCKSASEVRAVFERHWPRKPESETAQLIREIQAARLALESAK